MADVTLNELYVKLWSRVGAIVKPYAFYLAVNEAIEEFNTKNFMNEVEYNLPISSSGVGDLSDISENVIKVKGLRNHLNQRLLRKDTGGEYIANYADVGERVYEHVGNEIFVKLHPFTSIFTSNNISFTIPDTITYNGTTDDFWESHKLIPGVSFTTSGAANGANNDTFTVSTIGSTYISGSHDAGDGEIELTDSTQSWTPNALIGLTVTNNGTTGTGTIISNTATKIYAVLNVGYYPSGFWNRGDSYTITSASGNVLTITTATIVTEAVGNTIGFSISEYVYKLLGIFSLPKYSAYDPAGTITVEDVYKTPIILKTMLILIGKGLISAELYEAIKLDYESEMLMLEDYQRNRKEV